MQEGSDEGEEWILFGSKQMLVMKETGDRGEWQPLAITVHGKAGYKNWEQGGEEEGSNSNLVKQVAAIRVSRSKGLRHIGGSGCIQPTGGKIEGRDSSQVLYHNKNKKVGGNLAKDIIKADGIEDHQMPRSHGLAGGGGEDEQGNRSVPGE